MYQFMTNVKRLFKGEDGPTACEYATLLALIVIVAVVAIRLVGESARDAFMLVADALG